MIGLGVVFQPLAATTSHLSPVSAGMAMLVIAGALGLLIGGWALFWWLNKNFP